MTGLETKQRGRRAHLAVVKDDEPTVMRSVGNDYPMNVIACFGPAGSPGKSTLAANIATELALTGERVLLIDLDTLAPSLALVLGLVDTPAGLSACLRLSEQARLTKDEYERLTVSIQLGRQELRFMPGLSSPQRWPEVTPERLETLLANIRDYVDHVVLDLPQVTAFRPQMVHPSQGSNGSEINRDSLLTSVLTKADKLVVISGADPVAAQRFLLAQEYLAELKPRGEQFVVVNRFRTSALGLSAKAELEDTYIALANRRVDVYVPEDRENLDRAMLNGLPLALLKRSSPARQAIADLTKQILVSSKLFKERG